MSEIENLKKILADHLAAAVNSPKKLKSESISISVQLVKNLLSECDALEQLSLVDPVTGIGNPRHFQQVLQTEISRANRSKRPLAMIMIDVDHLKIFNDKNGHRAGSDLLKEVAQILKAGLRSTDFVARYGGDEFVILLPDTDLDPAVLVARRLCTKVHQTAVTISAGVTLFRPGQSATEFFNCADRLLYVAKAQGRDQISF